MNFQTPDFLRKLQYRAGQAQAPSATSIEETALIMSKAIKYAEKAAVYAAKGAWVVFGPQVVSNHPALGARPSRPHPCRAIPHHCTECGGDHQNIEGILPGGGHRGDL